MRQFWMIIFAILLAINVSACSPDDTPNTSEIPKTELPDDDNNNDNGGNESMKLTLRIGSSTFTATLADNETAKVFSTMLPMTINMRDVNNKEKFFNLSQSLPTAATSPDTIQIGDLMLYGASGLVLFYETFSTSYNYTRIGKIDNPSRLENALGAGSVTIVFEQLQD